MTRRSGLAAITAIVAIAFLAIMLTSVAFKASGATRAVTLQEETAIANAAADAGMQRAIITLRQAKDTWSDEVFDAGLDWSWLENDKDRKFQKLANDNLASYSVSIHKDSETGPLVTDLNHRPATTTNYFIVAYGQTSKGFSAVTTKTVSTITVKSRGGVLEYIHDRIQGVIDTILAIPNQKQRENSMRFYDSAILYNNDVWDWDHDGKKDSYWNSILTLTIQEGIPKKAFFTWDTDYGGLFNKTNWAYGNGNPNQIKNWFNSHPEGIDGMNYDQFVAKYFSNTQPSVISSKFKNPFRRPQSDIGKGGSRLLGLLGFYNYYDGKPSVINNFWDIWASDISLITSTDNPPFIAITDNHDYDPVRLFNIIEDIRKNHNQDWSQIWAILGTIFIYRDSGGTNSSDPINYDVKNPIYIWEVHVDQTPDPENRILDVYIRNPYTGKRAYTVDDVTPPDPNHPTLKAYETMYFTSNYQYPTN